MERLDAAPSPFRLPNGQEIVQINATETSLQYRNIFVDHCYLVGGIALAAGDVVVDVGANVGLFSLFAHWRAPEVTVYAFEPAQSLHAALEQNFARHQVRGAALRYALGKESGARDFVVYPEKTAMSGLYTDPERDLTITRRFLANTGFTSADVDDLLCERPLPRHEVVRVTTLSDWWDEAGIAAIDLLKLNVERAEGEVLAGIRDGHWRLIRQIAMQVHDEVEDIAALRSMLEDRGYQVAVGQDPLLLGTGIHELYARRASAQ